MSSAVRHAELCRASLQRHSKSFALAARLLPSSVRDDVAAIYAFCRRADDAVDRVPQAFAGAAVRRLTCEVDAIYRGAQQDEPVLAAFQDAVERHAVPRRYVEELLNGLRMDAAGTRYHDVATLLVYCYRVAATVGLMLCHVLGLSDPRARVRAAHLGIAMQLTNVCRDVREDFEHDRRYLPDELFYDRRFPQRPSSAQARQAVARAVACLLDLADAYYASADRGLLALPRRAALSIRVARLVYSEIGRRIRAIDYDVLSGRVRVSTWRKVWLVLRAAAVELARTRRGSDERTPLVGTVDLRDALVLPAPALCKPTS